MTVSIGFIFFMIIFAVVMILLCYNGILDFQCKAALLFTGNRLPDGERLVMESCTGRVSRKVKFSEDGKYEFSLETELTGGSAEVIILDSHRVEIARLDGDTTHSCAALNKGERYSLRWKFSHASGECRIKWEKKG